GSTTPWGLQARVILINLFFGRVFCVRIVDAHTKGAAIMREWVHVTVTSIPSNLFCPSLGLDTDDVS
ncbi:hypothetical protein LCGC14_2261040, partial [marine sediment metagenome]